MIFFLGFMFLIGCSWSYLFFKVRKLSALMDLSHDLHKESLNTDERNKEFYQGIAAKIEHCMQEIAELKNRIVVANLGSTETAKLVSQQMASFEARISAYPVVHDKLLNDVKTLKDWFNAQQQLVRDLEDKLQFFKEVNTNIIGRLEKQDSEIDHCITEIADLDKRSTLTNVCSGTDILALYHKVSSMESSIEPLSKVIDLLIKKYTDQDKLMIETSARLASVIGSVNIIENEITELWGEISPQEIFAPQQDHSQ